jgi:predicted lipoprotein with Yx(FWY)xxD motif
MAAVALLGAACGDDDDKATSTPTTAAPAATTAAATTAAASATTAAASATTAAAAATTAAAGSGGVVLKVADSAKGKVLVDATGFTLYTFKNDANGSGKSSCNGGCATTWPPVMGSAAPAKPDGATGDFTVITRDDGSKQIAYKGQPLYRYAPDAAPGDVKGDGVGNVWFVAAP